MKGNVSQPPSRALYLHFKFSYVSVWLTHLWDILRYSLSWASVTYQIIQHPQPGCSPSQPLNRSWGHNPNEYLRPKCIVIDDNARHSRELPKCPVLPENYWSIWLNHFLRQWIHQCNLMIWKSVSPFSLPGFIQWSLCSHIMIQKEQKLSSLLFLLYQLFYKLSVHFYISPFQNSNLSFSDLSLIVSTCLNRPCHHFLKSPLQGQTSVVLSRAFRQDCPRWRRNLMPMIIIELNPRRGNISPCHCTVDIEFQLLLCCPVTFPV